MTLPSHPNLSSFSLHCAIHRCMQLISKLFTPLFKSYYLRNIISLQNERALTKLSKSNEAYGSLETASRINSDIGNATFGGLKCYQWGKEGFFFLFSLLKWVCLSPHVCTSSLCCLYQWLISGKELLTVLLRLIHTSLKKHNTFFTGDQALKLK